MAAVVDVAAATAAAAAEGGLQVAVAQCDR